MNFPAGSFNPLVQATKFTRCYKTYQEQKHLRESEGEEYNPNVFQSKPPTNSEPTDGLKLGRDKDDSYADVPAPDFQSGMILIDPELKLLKAINDERNLLSKVGLKICATDDVRVVKDSNGNLKSAMAIGYSNMGQVIKIRYIDVDKDGANFQKSIASLAKQQSSPLKFYEGHNIDLERDDIDPAVLVD